VFTSILCPVDFSPHSERALKYALDLASLTGAHVTIVTAIDPFLDAATTASGHHEALMRQTQDEMERLLNQIERTPDVVEARPGIAVVKGKPAEEILKQITECRADLVVMGTQGLEGAKRFVFGSTTEQVLRESTVPVLAVPLPPQ
jgi:nucleotide-binding universal stress UspA family protein